MHIDITVTDVGLIRINLHTNKLGQNPSIMPRVLKYHT